MTEFSGIVELQVDALNRPTGLAAMTTGDVIYSGVLSTNVREAVTRVEDSSSTWDAGGGASAAGYENWNSAYTTLGTFSGNMETSTAGLSSITDVQIVRIDALATTSGFTGSAIASAIYCGNTDDSTSSIIVSGAGAGDAVPPVQVDGMYLTINSTAERLNWTKAPWIVTDGGEAQLTGVTAGVDLGNQNFGGTGNLDFATSELLARSIHISNALSGTAATVTTLDSSASISGCPYPPPFSFLQATADLGTGVDNFYFGSGVSVSETTLGSDGISFDATNGYWNISADGWYEVGADIGMFVTVSPSTVKNEVMRTTGYGGIETLLGYTTQELRTNIDPHLTRASWMGYLEDGHKIAIKCDTDAGTIKSHRYSTAFMKRIG